MEYRKLGRSDIEVSLICLGTMTWGEQNTEADAHDQLDYALDREVNFIDTADTYGRGRGEEILAHAFPGAARDKIVISTKFGYDWESVDRSKKDHQPAEHCFEPDFIERALNNSLQRLGTDYIDLWQLHNVRMEHLLRDDIWTLLDKFRIQGKIRSVGIALGPAIGWLDEGMYALEHLPIEIVYMIYNALELDPGRELIHGAE